MQKVSVLALSVIAYAMPPPPKWEALAIHAKSAVSPEALPLTDFPRSGEDVALATERKDFPRPGEDVA